MRDLVFVVHGMTCSACSDTVLGKLRSIPGVDRCALSLVTGECQVCFNEESGLSSDQILENVEDCGFDCEFVSNVEQGNGRAVSGKLHIRGMTCGACVSSVTKAIQALDGAKDVTVSLVTEECLVKFDPSKMNIDNIKEAIENSGFDAEVISHEDCHNKESNWKRANIHIENTNVEQGGSDVCDILRNERSISSAEFINENIIAVQYDSKRIGIRELLRKVRDLGYGAEVVPLVDSQHQLEILSKVNEIRFWRSTCFKSCFLAAFVMLLYMGVPMISARIVKERKFPYSEVSFISGLYYRDIIGLVIGTYIQFFVGAYFYKACWNSFKHRSGTMDTLVCISTTCAYAFSVYSIIFNIFNEDSNDKLPNVIFDTSVMLIAFISLGKLMENRAKSATSTALSTLISLTPLSCAIIENGDYQNPIEIPIELLQTNDIVEVKPGMRIPSDGKVITGETEVDESLMTGESLFVLKQVGSSVIGGSVNGPGHFYYQATNVGDDSKLANIIRTIKQAQLSKAPIQRYADFLASVFVPSILTLALLTFLMWIIVARAVKSSMSFMNTSNGIMYFCFQTAISVVIVACPCALGLAAPTAIMVGTGIGAENQVLIKGGEVLENFNKVKVFVFDKTGTLTTGSMSVKNFKSEDGSHLTNENLAAIRSSEALSGHPVAQAIVKYCDRELKNRKDIKQPAVKILFNKIYMGKGIKTKCEIGGTEFSVAIGNQSLMPTNWGQSSDLLASQNNDYTLSYVSINGKVVGRFDIIDNIKKDSYETIRYLNDHGFETYMVTGDTHSSAVKVAQLVGMDLNNVFSEVEPSGKSEIVQKLKNENDGKVIFVGDGINDSPALVISDVGIAISTGTDIAIEAADVVLLSDKQPDRASLKGLINALDIAQKTFKRIKLNIFWAVCYNTFMIPVAMGVLIPWGIRLHPMAAGLAMALSSVSVVLSSLMLKAWKPINLHDDPKTTSSSPRFWSKILSFREKRRTVDIEMQEQLLHTETLSEQQ